MRFNVQNLKNILIIVLGNISLALSTSIFVLPHEIVNGGTSGVSVIVNGLFEINPSIVITILCWILFLVGTIILGRGFAGKTLLSTILYPAFVSLFTNVGFFQDVSREITNHLLACLVGGVLTGFGLGVVYSVGGSTGGFDVVSLALKKYFKIKLSISTFVIDALIIVSGLFVISFENVLYGILCVLLSSYVIEKITISGSRSYMAHIVSEKAEEINEYLINKLERGTTLFRAEGGLSRNPKLVIEVVFNEKEYYEIKRNIYLIDKDAFISVYKSINAFGNGFEDIFVRGK